jgi:acyl-CoA thioester hydrolase
MKMNLSLTEPVHQTECRVLYGDTDAAGVVYYANFLRYFEKGRTEYMRNLALTYREIEHQGLLLPVIESYSRYKASAAYDDLLIIETSLVELKRISCRFNYRISRKNDDNSKKLLVKGFTVHASVDREGKLTKLPAEVFDRLKSILDQAQ